MAQRHRERFLQAAAWRIRPGTAQLILNGD
jgi:hypothetical protein